MALSPDILKEHFEKVEKCKISWIIEKVQINNWGSCLSELKIYINSNNIIHKINWIMQKNDCIIDSYNKVFFENDLKIWRSVNFVLDQNYSPLEFYPDNIDTSNIPYCTWTIIKEREVKTFEINNSQNYILIWLFFLILIIWIIVFKIYKRKS